jgi:hypothetical protein
MSRLNRPTPTLRSGTVTRPRWYLTRSSRPNFRPVSASAYLPICVSSSLAPSFWIVPSLQALFRSHPTAHGASPSSVLCLSSCVWPLVALSGPCRGLCCWRLVSDCPSRAGGRRARRQLSGGMRSYLSIALILTPHRLAPTI